MSRDNSIYPRVSGGLGGPKTPAQITFLFYFHHNTANSFLLCLNFITTFPVNVLLHCCESIYATFKSELCLIIPTLFNFSSSNSYFFPTFFLKSFLLFSYFFNKGHLKACMKGKQMTINVFSNVDLSRHLAYCKTFSFVVINVTFI